MAISGQSLADGQVAASPAALYTAAAVTYEKTLTLCNVGGATETTKVYFTRSGSTRRRIRTLIMDPDESYEITIALPMSIGDAIEAETTNATSVDYVLGGGVNV